MTEVATSGIEVPAATMVSAITRSLTPSALREARSLPSTSQPEPRTSSTRPATDQRRPAPPSAASHAAGRQHLGRTRRVSPASGGATARSGTPCRRPAAPSSIAHSGRPMRPSSANMTSSSDAPIMIGTSWRMSCALTTSGVISARQAEDEQHVEDVAADDVAHRHVGAAVERRSDRDGHLRRTGSHRDDGQPDHQRRDAERKRQARAPRTSRSAPATSARRPPRNISNCIAISIR